MTDQTQCGCRPNSKAILTMLLRRPCKDNEGGIRSSEQNHESSENSKRRHWCLNGKTWKLVIFGKRRRWCILPNLICAMRFDLNVFQEIIVKGFFLKYYFIHKTSKSCSFECVVFGGTRVSYNSHILTICGSCLQVEHDLVKWFWQYIYKKIEALLCSASAKQCHHLNRSGGSRCIYPQFMTSWVAIHEKERISPYGPLWGEGTPSFPAPGNVSVGGASPSGSSPSFSSLLVVL